MFTPQRQNAIIEFLQSQKAAAIQELATRFSVSAMTIRRDLDELERQGLVQRTHGGAVLTTLTSVPDPAFVQREGLQSSVKHLIAQKAAELVLPGEVVILDSGTTVAAMTDYLENKSPMTVITYSLPIIFGLGGKSGCKLICTGGELDQDLNALVGPLTEKMLEGVRVDRAFIGASSLDPQLGFSNSNLQNLTLQKILLRVARQVYLLVDSSKFSRQPYWLVAGLDSLTGIITDEAVPARIKDEIEEMGITVITVPTFQSSDIKG